MKSLVFKFPQKYRIDETVNKYIFLAKPNGGNQTVKSLPSASGQLMVNRPLAGCYRVIMLAYLMIIHYLNCMQSDNNK